jgi:hypothetical protein
MAFNNCPTCGLSIRVYPNRIAPEHCPRCIARSRVAIPMYSAVAPAQAGALTDGRAATDRRRRFARGAGVDAAA